MIDTKDNWENAVIKILKTELIKKDITYAELLVLLEKIGVVESESGIKNKMSRGTFRASWFVQVLKAIGVKEIDIDDSYFKEKND